MSLVVGFLVLSTRLAPTDYCAAFDPKVVLCNPIVSAPHDAGGFPSTPVPASTVGALLAAVPLYPGSGGGTQSVSAELVTHPDGHLRYDSAVAVRYGIATDASLDAITQWYVNALTSTGWTPEGGGESNEIDFARGSRAKLSIIVAKPGYQVTVSVLPYACGTLDSCGYLGKVPQKNVP